jgi:hypothetical protein
MRNLTPKAVGVLLALLFLIKIGYSQNTVTVKSSMIGAIQCDYLKTLKDNGEVQFAVQLIFKNQQYIYKQESDTLVFTTPNTFQQFIKDIKEGMSIIDQEDKSMSIERSNYILSKDNIYMDHKKLSLSNPALTITTSFNAYSGKELLSWLTSIELGK